MYENKTKFASPARSFSARVSYALSRRRRITAAAHLRLPNFGITDMAVRRPRMQL